MRKRILSAAALACVVAGCASGVPTQPDWKFIQKVGGLSISELKMAGGVYYLPVHMSVESHDKAMVCTNSTARVAGKEIWLRILTDSKKNAPDASAQCPDARIGGIPDGNYRVMFIGPDGARHKLGDVTANLADG